MKRRNFVYGGLAAIAVGATGYAVTRGDSPRGTAPQTADAKPVAADGGLATLMNQTLPDVDGRMTALSQWAGKPLLVNFWATWCAPCVQEMPELDQLARAYPNVQFVGIGIDSTDNIRAFQRKVPVNYPLLVLENNGVELLRAMGNGPGGLPFTVIVHPQGRVDRHILGQVDADDIAKTLSRITA